jgi:hypothetical protein
MGGLKQDGVRKKEERKEQKEVSNDRHVSQNRTDVPWAAKHPLLTTQP